MKNKKDLASLEWQFYVVTHTGFNFRDTNWNLAFTAFFLVDLT